MDRKIPLILAAILSVVVAAETSAQDPITGRSKLGDELNKVLNDPAEMAKAERERNRPPMEIFKSYVMPNDVLPYVKANHWSTMALELRSNQIDYHGALETQPIPLIDMPHAVVFRREANLVKGQRSRLLIQLMTPKIGREVLLRLMRPESLRDDEVYNAALRALEPHQMLIPVLTKGPNDAYGRWNQLRALFPLSGLKSDTQVYDRQRYYRMVLPADPTRPELPSHPLTWTTISHVIWDGMPPETLSISQQEAMLDWLHWGGQIVLIGGAGPAFAPLRESFIGPFLPAEPSGEGAQLTAADLEGFAKSYPSYANPVEPDEPIEGTQTYGSAFEEVGKRYKAPAPILVPRDKPLYVTALTPKPGARVIGFEKPGLPPLAVEWRVGRGRITMLSVSLTDPQLMAWPGYETMVRRVILRRPEENLGEPLRYNGNGLGGYLPPRYDMLTGPELTWLRLFGRDLGAPTRRVRIDDDDGTTIDGSTQIGAVAIPAKVASTPSLTPASLAATYNPYQVPVAEWLDNAALPAMSRSRLEHASGIEIPGRRFVMTVILAYMALLVPLNWVVCRFALGRKELAWLVVPVLALGFAFAVERAAAYDVGYDSACNEIDLIETFGDYSRGHLSRFASLYTTGRVKYAISYPGDPTALALPLNTGRAIRGEDIQESTFQATPTPSLTNFQAQPRSLAMFRAEQLTTLPGTATLIEENGVRKVVNGTGVELKDAIVVEIAAGSSRTTTLGTIAAGATVEIKGDQGKTDDYKAPPTPGLKKNEVDPSDFMTLVVNASIAARPEDVGEVRLVAWTIGPRGGQTIEPAVDVHKGFTLVVAHLKVGPTPDPASPRYNILARGPETPSTLMLNTPPPPVVTNPAFMMMRNRMPASKAAPPRVMPPPPPALPTMPKPRPVDPNDIDADGNPKVDDPEKQQP